MSGKVIYYQSIATWLWALLVIVLIFLILSIAAYVKFADRVTVSGHVRLEPDTIEIFSSLSGIITKLHVSEGLSIEEGVPLIEVTSLAGVDSSEYGDYKRKIQLMESSIDNSHARKELLLKKVDNAERHLDYLSSSYSTIRKELEQKLQNEESNIDKGERMLNELLSPKSRKALSQLEIYSFEEGMTSQVSKALDTQIRVKKFRQLYIDNERQLNKEIIDSRLGIVEEEGRVTSLLERILELHNKHIFTPRSPCAAHVLTVNVSENQSVSAGQKLLSISSVSAKMLIELTLDSTSVGAVSVGDEVYMKFDSFPYQTHGIQKGTIIKIDREAQNVDDLRSRRLTHYKFAFFALVEINNLTSELTGDRLALKPGMSVKAEILLEKRTLFSWLFGRP